MPDLIVVGVSVIALATSLSSLLYTRRMAHEAQRANDVAAQSQEDERQLHAVRWVIERAHGDGLLLRNTGYETADEVYVDVPDMLAISDVPLGQTSVAPGDAVAMTIERYSRNAPISDVAVSWRGRSMAAYVPIPPRKYRAYSG